MSPGLGNVSMEMRCPELKLDQRVHQANRNVRFMINVHSDVTKSKLVINHFKHFRDGVFCGSAEQTLGFSTQQTYKKRPVGLKGTKADT